ncbi:fimbria/pilus outer membrane usher protein [Pacificimonas flava]|uniref:fimbria/pilus outer membrane usher protein n=1 Tax=Pacificimonas flava TaxID=1234595 RepID=UPI00135F1C06|nr:fimbria/pilus outer membrane usher protein [Pacificimonas flava]MBB5281193.1 outer membrane usher protein [Pacificimonas flava]
MTAAAEQPAIAPLYVELVVNGQATGDLVELRLDGAHEYVDISILRRAGLNIGGAGEIDLTQVEGVYTRYDAANQTLALDIRPDLLPVQRLAENGVPSIESEAGTGVTLNYDLYLQHSENRSEASLWTEQRLFGSRGSLSNSGIARTSSRTRARYLRYDTRLIADNPDQSLSYAAGDLITRSLPWSSSVRLGGLQIARNFRLRPDLVTVPLPRFSGMASLPSSVDLFVDGFRQQSSEVSPGPFVLEDVPVVNGAGEATVVTTDAVGRQISTSVPFYVSSELLRPGLSDYAAEIGFVRKDYGLRSFSYGGMAASGSLRTGLTQHLTLEAHAEAARGLALAGAGLVAAPFRVGTVNASVALSSFEGRTTTQWSAGYSYRSRNFGLSFQHNERGADFRDLGSFDLRNIEPRHVSDRLIASGHFRGIGSFGAALISVRAAAERPARLASLTYTRSIGRQASLVLGLDTEFESGNVNAQMRLVIPWGATTTSGAVSHSPGRGGLVEASHSRSAPFEGGWGYDVDVAANEDGDIYGQGNLRLRTAVNEMQLGASTAYGNTLSWASTTGSVVFMDGSAFFANSIGESFAVVATEAEGVGVTFENRYAGKTNRNGHLLISSVPSYLPVRFSLDTLALSLDHSVEATERRAAFARGAGAVVRMPVRKARSITVLLTDAAGEPLPPGERVTVNASQDLQTGWDGIVFIENASDDMVLEVKRRSGPECKVSVAIPDDISPLAQLGPFACAA